MYIYIYINIRACHCASMGRGIYRDRRTGYVP